MIFLNLLSIELNVEFVKFCIIILKLFIFFKELELNKKINEEIIYI